VDGKRLCASLRTAAAAASLPAPLQRGGQCWQFRAAGGQSSLMVDESSPEFRHELKSVLRPLRSMLVLLNAPLAPAPAWWSPAPAERGWFPFRWHPPGGAGGARKNNRTLPACGQRLAGPGWRRWRAWPGSWSAWSARHWPSTDPSRSPCATSFRSRQFSGQRPLRRLRDGLVCSLPETLPRGHLPWQVGCRSMAGNFNQVSLHYGSQTAATALGTEAIQSP